MWRHLLLITLATGQQLVYKYNVSCDNATNTLVKDERRGPDGDWVGEWVEPGGGWVPNYVRINLRARYIHEMGGDNSSKLAKQLCHSIGATIATIYSEEEDELAYAACKPADCWIGLEEDGGVPDYLCDGKCGTAETWWGEQVRAGVPCDSCPSHHEVGGFMSDFELNRPKFGPETTSRVDGVEAPQSLDTYRRSGSGSTIQVVLSG